MKKIKQKIKTSQWVLVVGLFLGSAMVSYDSSAADKKAEPKSVDLPSLILNKVFASIGRPNLRVRLNFSLGSKGGGIKEISGKFQLPFKKNIDAIPLTTVDPSSGDGEIGKILPFLDLETEDLVVQWTLDTVPGKDGHKTLVNTVEFLNHKGQAAALVAQSNSEVTEYVQIVLRKIRFDFAGLEADVGKVTVDGSCNAAQGNYDVFHGGVAVNTPITCKFDGYVYKEKDDYEFNLIYDGKGDGKAGE